MRSFFIPLVKLTSIRSSNAAKNASSFLRSGDTVTFFSTLVFSLLSINSYTSVSISPERISPVIFFHPGPSSPSFTFWSLPYIASSSSLTLDSCWFTDLIYILAMFLMFYSSASNWSSTALMIAALRFPYSISTVLLKFLLNSSIVLLILSISIFTLRARDSMKNLASFLEAWKF